MSNVDIATVEYFSELKERIETAQHGTKKAIIDEASRFMCMSKDLIYKGLISVGWKSDRKQRADSGKSKLSKEETKLVSSLIVASTRDNKKILLSQCDAIDIARANGADINVSKSTLSRQMKKHGFHPAQLAKPAPHTQLKSLHPNYAWEFDVSICTLYYLDDDGLADMDKIQFYKNKPQNFSKISKQRVLRYVMTDHYTGTIFLRYYLGSGESSELLLDFLIKAFTRREDPQDPFHGVPFFLLWDKGSANLSYLAKNFLDRLQVQHSAHETGHSNVKGQVENAQNIIERSFEGRLRFGQVRGINQLNEKAREWMCWYNSTKKHSRHGNTRYALWQTIRKEQLRICPPVELCMSLATTKPESRDVNGGLQVNFKVKGYEAHVYSVEHVPGIRVGEKIDVCVNPYKAPNIFVITQDSDGTEKLYECEPLLRDSAGFFENSPVIGESFRTMPDTVVDLNRKAIDKAAYDADTPEEVAKARKAKKPAFGGEIDAFSYLKEQTNTSFMKRHGVELDVPGQMQVEMQPLSHIEACKRLCIELGESMTREQNELVKEWYPDGVPEEDLSTLLIRLQGEPLQTVNSNLSIVK